jgi:hypothetical protein
LDEIVVCLENFGLKEVELVEGFDPNDMFIAHMETIGYSSYFTKIEKFKEGARDHLDIPETTINQDLNDMEDFITTNEGY